MKLMPETLARRIVCLLLLIAGTDMKRIIELTNVSERSIWNIKKAVTDNNVESLFIIERGAGRPSKAKDIESEIIEELSKNNYHTRQQVADMIKETFGISMSVTAVGKLLKKKGSDV
jgi:transposase